jgi:Flp pilus assembly protein TadG
MTKVEFRRNLQQTQNARRTGLLRFTARRFRRREDGAVLVEFAIILPILAVLFLGLAEFTEAFSVNRKLAGAAGAVADLVAQEASVNNDFLADTDSLAQELMKPHNTAPFQLVVVSIVADADNTTTVDWSYPSGAYAKGAGYALPDGAMTSPNSSMIVAEARYNFTPTVGQFLGTFEMSETAYFRPRLAQKVMKTN